MSHLKMIGLTALALIVAGLVLGLTTVPGAQGLTCGSVFHPISHHDRTYDPTCEQALASARQAPVGLLIVGGILGVGAAFGAVMADGKRASGLYRAVGLPRNDQVETPQGDGGRRNFTSSDDG